MCAVCPRYHLQCSVSLKTICLLTPCLSRSPTFSHEQSRFFCSYTAALRLLPTERLHPSMSVPPESPKDTRTRDCTSALPSSPLGFSGSYVCRLWSGVGRLEGMFDHRLGLVDCSDCFPWFSKYIFKFLVHFISLSIVCTCGGLTWHAYGVHSLSSHAVLHSGHQS